MATETTERPIRQGRDQQPTKLEREASEWIARELKALWDREISDRPEAMRQLGIDLGERYWGAELNNYEVYDTNQGEVLARMRSIADNMREELHASIVLLFGEPGTGKDHIVAAMLKIAIQRWNMRSRFIDGGELFDHIYFATKAQDDEALRRLQATFITGPTAPHVLAISDPQPVIGEMNPTHARRLRDIIDRRYRRNLCTIITTNLSGREETERFLGKPVVDRIRGKGDIVLCEWESYRVKRKV